MPQIAGNNFGFVAEVGQGLVTQGVALQNDTQLLVEATVGPANDTNLVVAVRENSGEFFSIVVPAADLADDGQAIVDVSDFFFNGDVVDGIPNGFITEVSFQSPFGPGNAVDSSVQRISAINGTPFLLGDVNLDGEISFLDISPFIERLSDMTFQAEADIDQNEVVNFLDISPFIGLLSGQ